MCNDGSPATFTRYDFQNGALTARESVNFTNRSEQKYRLYNKGVFNKAGEQVIRLNIWDWHADWQFELYENGVKVVLDDIDVINQLVSDPKSLIALEIEEVKENFGFFFDGSLREVFQPLVDLITQRGSETSTP